MLLYEWGKNLFFKEWCMYVFFMDVLLILNELVKYVVLNVSDKEVFEDII